jgi:hypothetical protein
MNFRLRLLGAVSVLFLVGCSEKGSSDNLSEKQKEEIKRIANDVVKNMLADEPELFVKAIDLAMHKQQQQAAQKIEERATEEQDTLLKAPIVIGNKEAKVKLVVFFDPLEPISQKFRDEVVNPTVKERNDVGFFCIPVSVLSSTGAGSQDGPVSLVASKAIIAACEQSPAKAIALWEKMPPGDQKEVTQTSINKYAKEVGLAVDQLEKDMKDSHEKLIENGKLALKIGVPAQLPVVFILTKDRKFELVPPFVKDKMRLVLDAVRLGKPWAQAIAASLQEAEEEAQKTE